MDNLNQVEFCYRGAIDQLNTILKQEKSKKVLIFRGKSSFDSIKDIINPQLKWVKVTYYNDFSTNPKKEEIEKAISKLGTNYDMIIAVGGGSVMDFAKAYRYYTGLNTKLIAIPTTCGTGAESTQFAVVYISGKKTSLDEKSILPDYAIVDCQFSENNPRYLKACTAMDAYCQAIESFWAVKSTDESREYAKQAIELCRDNIVQYVNGTDENASEKMTLASHFAGKAINISRTTAAHAISYKITSDYGIPHGHAVALTIAKLFEKNLESGMFDELKELITNEPISYFNELFNQIGLECDLLKLGINDINSIVENVNIERLSNNPVRLSKEEIMSLFEKQIQ